MRLRTKNEPVTEGVKTLYLIGEALVGDGNEVAHIDLIIGEKTGPVGQAFANGLATLSAGHTPLIAVIRPNLPSKPYTLIIPKVTVKDMEQASKIFGPAQAAVAKAIADAVEEKILPAKQIEDLVIIASVFIHPEAKDYRKIYQFNYGATKLALKRALTGYPALDKIMFDKDRARHPIMGFRVPRLWMPPYLQIALDIPDVERAKKIITEIPSSDRIILEVGTPLLKKYGVGVIKTIREEAKDVFIVADLKTLDVGQVEVDMAYEETADAVVVSGLAPKDTIDKFIYETKRFGIYSFIEIGTGHFFPSMSVSFVSSTIMTSCLAAESTIFSRVKAAPPPLIMFKLKSIWSAPSIAMSRSGFSSKLVRGILFSIAIIMV